MNLIGKYITLTKVSDDVFEGNHPNGVFVGNQLSGYIKTKPVIGEQLYLYPSLKGVLPPCAWTSILVAIDTKSNLIKTENSTYKFEIQ
jgi:hypothetical protein